MGCSDFTLAGTWVKSSRTVSVKEIKIKTFSKFKLGTVGPRLLRRLGHANYDAIFEVDAIFEGWTLWNVQNSKTFCNFSSNVTFVVKYLGQNVAKWANFQIKQTS